MHELLPFYGKRQKSFLKWYMRLASLSRWPLAGGLVKKYANHYARKQHGGYLLNLSEAKEILDMSENIYLGPCSCREVFKNCDATVMAEIIIGAGGHVYRDTLGKFKPISREQALEVIISCQQAGLMTTLVHCKEHFYSICNCCRCCCVPYRLKHQYGIEFALVRDKNIVNRFAQFLKEEGLHGVPQDIQPPKT